MTPHHHTAHRAHKPRAASLSRRGRPRRLGRWLVLLAGLCGLLGWALAARLPQRARGDGQTLVVRKGGTYSGTYYSPDSQVPCVRIATTEPVILRDCVLRGAGNLIEAMNGGARLTVVNCRGYGLPPSADDARHGRFVVVVQGRSVRVEHNYFEGTTGIDIYQWSGNGTPGQTLTVRYNQSRNIDGRLRNGGEANSNFLGLNALPGLENIEVAWNEVINEPDKSLVEDNINFYNSGGTRRSPARVHDNYIRGAYPFPATLPDYTGSGITMDGDGKAALSVTAYVEAYRNQVLSTCNAAMNIAAGHDNHFYNNRMVSAGRLPDGTRLRANWAATAVWNASERPKTVFFNNTIHNNTIGYVHWGTTAPLADRQDLSPRECPFCPNNVLLPSPITLQTEQAEWVRWQQKLRQQGVQVGPVPPGRRPSPLK